MLTLIDFRKAALMIWKSNNKSNDRPTHIICHKQYLKFDTFFLDGRLKKAERNFMDIFFFFF